MLSIHSIEDSYGVLVEEDPYNSLPRSHHRDKNESRASPISCASYIGEVYQEPHPTRFETTDVCPLCHDADAVSPHPNVTRAQSWSNKTSICHNLTSNADRREKGKTPRRSCLDTIPHHRVSFMLMNSQVIQRVQRYQRS